VSDTFSLSVQFLCKKWVRKKICSLLSRDNKWIRNFNFFSFKLVEKQNISDAAATTAMLLEHFANLPYGQSLNY
jgi:hypothetical protein